jgi:hypothetical protein
MHSSLALQHNRLAVNVHQIQPTRTNNLALSARNYALNAKKACTNIAEGKKAAK